jgi:hypothetical protein
MPAWMAGIQVCRMRPETSMSAWIPALHAGMTESRSRTKTNRGAPPFLFSKEDSKITKEEKIVFEIRLLFQCCSTFFASFVRFVVSTQPKRAEKIRSKTISRARLFQRRHHPAREALHGFKDFFLT